MTHISATGSFSHIGINEGRLAAEIVEDLRAALAQFQEIADDLATDEAAV